MNSAERNKYLNKFQSLLEANEIRTFIKKNEIVCSSDKRSFSFEITEDNCNGIPFDLIVTQPGKLVAIIQSKLKLNKTVFARNCEMKKIDKLTAQQFLDKYHIMNSTQSAFNLGLLYKDELLALASFSKGRKMDRLPADKRSFELIRFCCKKGITVTGGLTKLVKNFCKEKNAGDIMTYIDKQFSPGDSFIKSGFIKHSETGPNYFLVSKKTFKRISIKNADEKFDEAVYYLVQNSGNIKLVYTPVE